MQQGPAYVLLYPVQLSKIPWKGASKREGITLTFNATKDIDIHSPVTLWQA